MAKYPEHVLRKLVEDFPKVFGDGAATNPTGKSYLRWTSNDLKSLGSGDLETLRTVVYAEQYEYLDKILPEGMSRAEFSRAVLRESARRGQIKNLYLKAFGDTPGFNTQKVTVERQAFGTPHSLPSKVTELAAVIAIRDASIDIAVNNAPAFGLRDDVSNLLGKKNDTVRPIDSDAEAYDFGYTVGAMPEFKQADALNVRLNSPLPPDQIQKEYCPVIENLFQTGRAYNNRDSLVLGFMQARIDGRTNFEPTSDRVGLFAECPSTKQKATAAR